MKGTTKARARKTPEPPVTPINFRMPAELRARLRGFARERHIGEADALRLVVSEHLDEVQNARELNEAERWQLAQAYATWDKFRAGEGRTVSSDEVRQIFVEALAASAAVPRTR
ncbi:MAG: hypothetical protein M3O91_00055 [Chloroflexota bacterium]|nr:hypothetical protein [Chloroflexota bacterium]